MRKGLLSSTLIILIIFSIVTVSINITPAYGVPITPIISNSNTQESTPNTTLTNTDVVITAANLESGKKYVILYSAAYGGTSTTDVIEVAVDYGGTVIAKSSDDGSSSGTPESMRIHNMAGYYVLTGDGTILQTWQYGGCDIKDYKTMLDENLAKIKYHDKYQSEITDYMLFSCNGFWFNKDLNN